MKLFKLFKFVGRKFKKAPWRKVATIGVKATTGIDITNTRVKPQGTIERTLRLIRTIMDGWIEWFESRRSE